MRIRLLCVSACFITFTVIALSAADSRPNQKELWSESEWKWLGENFHNALDHALPLEKGINILVSYRMYETLQIGAPEYSFSISEYLHDANQGLSVHVRVADPEPIGYQLLLFHRKHPLGSISESEKALHFKDWVISERQCPTLRDAVQKLRHLHFELPSDEFEPGRAKIYLDPTVHEFHVNSNSGSIDAALVDYENPLVRWGLNTRQTFQACATDTP